MPRCFNLFYEIFVLKPLTIALYKHTLVRGILYIPAENNRGVFRIQFHRAAYAVSLLASHECAS